jgi:hypothetical protein
MAPALPRRGFLMACAASGVDVAILFSQKVPPQRLFVIIAEGCMETVSVTQLSRTASCMAKDFPTARHLCSQQDCHNVDIVGYTSQRLANQFESLTYSVYLEAQPGPLTP